MMMNRFIFIVILAVVILLGTVSCKQGMRPPVEEETPSQTVPLDPLATKTDREVVPEIYPIHVASVSDAGDSLVKPNDVSFTAFDSSLSETNPTEVYRVQIFTSRLYNEAAKELSLANEIFNQPVHLDYEVPYYKLRVGDFATREEAENMVPEIKAIGYRGAWVARVVKRIRPALTFDERDEPILPSETPDTVYVEPTGTDSTAVPEDTIGESNH